MLIVQQVFLLCLISFIPEHALAHTHTHTHTHKVTTMQRTKMSKQSSKMAHFVFKCNKEDYLSLSKQSHVTEETEAKRTTDQILDQLLLDPRGHLFISNTTPVHSAPVDVEGKQCTCLCWNLVYDALGGLHK